jgi:hypothetical protein
VDEPDDRNLTDVGDGFLTGKRFLIHDRDPRFTLAFRETLATADVQVARLPPPVAESQCLRGALCANHLGIMSGSDNSGRGTVPPTSAVWVRGALSSRTQPSGLGKQIDSSSCGAAERRRRYCVSRAARRLVEVLSPTRRVRAAAALCENVCSGPAFHKRLQRRRRCGLGPDVFGRALRQTDLPHRLLTGHRGWKPGARSRSTRTVHIDSRRHLPGADHRSINWTVRRRIEWPICPALIVTDPADAGAARQRRAPRRTRR